MRNCSDSRASASTAPTTSRRPGTRRWQADRPVVFEAFTDPNVSLLPPHISLEQAKNFAHALLKGDPDERGLIVEQAQTVFAGMFPGGGRDGR